MNDPAQPSSELAVLGVDAVERVLDSALHRAACTIDGRFGAARAAALLGRASKLRGERTSLAQTVSAMEARFVRLEQAMHKTTVPAVKDVSASADVK